MRTVDLHALLHDHCAADQKEARDLERMRVYAETLSQPFSRDQAGAHFTASAIVSDDAGLQTCLVHHRKLNRWLQPGGHFETSDGGDPVRAAQREVLEETGCESDLIVTAPLPLDVDIHEIPAYGEVPAHLHLDVRMLVRARTATLAHDPDESHGVKWVTWEAALEHADDPSLFRALSKARRFLL